MRAWTRGGPWKPAGVILTVTPNPAVDRTLQMGEIRQGEVNRIRSVRVEPSGKGVNVSRALTVNGLASLAVLPIGGAEGAQLLALLRAEEVPHRPVPVAGSSRVNISISSAGQVTKLNEPGPVLTPEEGSALLDAVGAELAGTALTGTERPAGPPAAGWVVGSGALPPGLPAGFHAEIAAYAEAVGARFALDSSGAALSKGLDARPALVKPNLAELESLAGRPLPTIGAVADAAHQAGRTTGGTILVSLGARGALLVDAEGVLHACSAVTEVVNPVGAGDNLLAGFLAGLTHGHDRSAALREAVAWATVAVGAPGSVGPRVTATDRAAVRLDSDPDPAQASS